MTHRRRKIAQPKIACPKCGHQFSRVTDSRPSVLGIYESIYFGAFR